MRTPEGFFTVLSRDLGSLGWETGDRRKVPPALAVLVQEFSLPLDDGWVARLLVSWFPRDVIEVSKWRRGMRYVVMLDAEVTVPAAELLGRRCGAGRGGLGNIVDPEFEVAGEEPGQRQLRGPEDHAGVVGEIVAYARDVLKPWASEHANLDTWLRRSEELAENEPELLAWDVPVMLVERGRFDAARERLTAARANSEWLGDDFAEFAELLEAYMADPGAFRGKEPVPEPEPRPEPKPEAAEHLSLLDRFKAEDPIRSAFYDALDRELAGARPLPELVPGEADDWAWYAPVAYFSDCEEFLEQVHDSWGPPVQRQVELQGELLGRSKSLGGGVEVSITGRIVGVVPPEYIPTWGVELQLEGTKLVQLTRKNERPRFLLEIDIVQPPR